jgi:biopolymer transport protein ExbD
MPIRFSRAIHTETCANIAVSNTPMPMRMKTIAVPFAAIFAVLAVVVADGSRPAVGLPVRISKIRSCKAYEEDIRRVFIQVLRPGIVQLNSEPPLPKHELAQRLAAIFRTRVYRYVLVTGAPELHFEDVAEIIDLSAQQVDQVVLVTPSVLSQLAARTPGVCFDENLPLDYIRHSR